MKNRKLWMLLLAVLTMVMFTFAGCGSTADGDSAGSAAALENGTYIVDFTTDSNMFHTSDAYEANKALLTVNDGEMTVHVSLQSKKIVNLYAGLAEDAAKDGAELIDPTVDTVTYADGYTQEVYGFDIPVPALDEEFDVALIGRHGNWYDHKVVVSNPIPGTELPIAGAENNEGGDAANAEPVPADLPDEEYSVNIAMDGGTGKASITSPAKYVVKDGQGTLTVEWSSENYDYMIVDGEKYLPVNTEGNSVFEIPVTTPDQAFTVIADTTAMSQPHEIEYTLTLTLAK